MFGKGLCMAGMIVAMIMMVFLVLLLVVCAPLATARQQEHHKGPTDGFPRVPTQAFLTLTTTARCFRQVRQTLCRLPDGLVHVFLQLVHLIRLIVYDGGQIYRQTKSARHDT